MTLTDEAAVRYVRASAVDSVDEFLASQLYLDLVDAGEVLPVTRREELRPLAGPARPHTLEKDPPGAVYEQPRVGFLSYPYEWPAAMLHDAARLTLRIASRALSHGWGLKDATPFNVAFRGSIPVFLDLLSFEKREPGDPVWLPYGQFVRTFLLPLLSFRRRGGVPFDGARDGIEPERMAESLSISEKLRSPALQLVTLPSLLHETRPQSSRARAAVNPDKARFILERLFVRLSRNLDKLEPGDRESRWTSYASDVHDRAYHEAKREIVRGVFEITAGCRLLDIGCNTGSLSVMAATLGNSVVAIDSDPAVVGRLYRIAARDKLDVLPLVVDIAEPTPGRGWRNREQLPFLARAAGGFDMVIAAGIIHHLMLGAGIPLASIIELLADLTSRSAIVEFVPASDPMFVRLARGRDEMHTEHTRELFVSMCKAFFTVRTSHPIGATGREIFVLDRKPD